MTRQIPFTKMHGAGNDYIYVNTMQYPIEEPEKLSIAWSAYHTGIGSDGLVLIGSSNVAGMLQRSLHIPAEHMLPQLDATDALGAALCHFFQSSNPVSEKKYSSWKDFIAKNPDKVKR